VRRDSRAGGKTQTITEAAAWVVVVLGVCLAILAGQQTATLLTASDTWVREEATVLRTEVGPVSTRGFTMVQREPAYRVRQQVVYFRKGNRYQEALLLAEFDSLEAAERFAAGAEKPGTRRSVWVNPADPTQLRGDYDSSRAKGLAHGFLTLFRLALAPEQAPATGASASRI
jgi:hypothetical protein